VWVSSKPLISEEIWPGQGLNPGLPNDTPALHAHAHLITIQKGTKMLSKGISIWDLVWLNINDQKTEDSNFSLFYTYSYTLTLFCTYTYIREEPEAVRKSN
jgi:hypothetical protein